MVLPPPKSQVAFAGGLGLEALSDCADPSRAIIPMAKHPAPRNATLLFMVSLLRSSANIQTDLWFFRNCNCRRSLETHAAAFCFVSPSYCETGEKGLNLGKVGVGRRMSVSLGGL
jgi:hypothetical protein